MEIKMMIPLGFLLRELLLLSATVHPSLSFAATLKRSCHASFLLKELSRSTVYWSTFPFTPQEQRELAQEFATTWSFEVQPFRQNYSSKKPYMAEVAGCSSVAMSHTKDEPPEGSDLHQAVEVPLTTTFWLFKQIPHIPYWYSFPAPTGYFPLHLIDLDQVIWSLRVSVQYLLDLFLEDGKWAPW